MTNDPRPVLTYRVRIGHYDIVVKARDTTEAILLVKRQLARELPRLYDVIRTLAASRFQVENAA